MLSGSAKEFAVRTEIDKGHQVLGIIKPVNQQEITPDM